MSGFANPIIGGGGALAYPSIHSPNYVPGVSGWSIEKNGNVEFNSGTFRGTISGGQFAGTNFVINSAGAFFYSGIPAHGNLFLSISSISGIDSPSLGNHFVSGFSTYDNVAGTGTQVLGAAINLLTGSLALGWTIHSSITLSSANVTIQQLLDLLAGLAVIGGTTTDTLIVSGTSALNGETTVTPQQMSGHPVIEQTDQSTITVTSASVSNITTAWAINATDAQNGTAYRLKAAGYGTQGSTQQTLRAQLTFMGVNVGSGTIPATVVPASGTFEWSFEGTISVVTNGAAGTARAHGVFTIAEIAGGGTPLALVIGDHTGVDATVNTTANQTVRLQVNWGSTTGAPTITGRWSTLARVGP